MFRSLFKALMLVLLGALIGFTIGLLKPRDRSDFLTPNPSEVAG